MGNETLLSLLSFMTDAGASPSTVYIPSGLHRAVQSLMSWKIQMGISSKLRQLKSTLLRSEYLSG